MVFNVFFCVFFFFLCFLAFWGLGTPKIGFLDPENPGIRSGNPKIDQKRQIFDQFWGCLGECLGGVWRYFGGCLGGVWACFANIFVEFWTDLGGNNGLKKLKKKRIIMIILFCYFVLFLIYLYYYLTLN